MKNTNLSQTFKMVRKSISKRSPEILLGVGIAGMITTTVMAVKATPKALKLIEEAEEKKEERLTKVEVVQTAWKPYIPSILICTASVSCLIGAGKVNARKHAALYSAYKLSETALAEFKEKTEEAVSEKKLKEIKHKIAEDKVYKAVEKEETKDKKTTVIVSSDDETWFIDPYTNEPFRSTTAKIDAAINRVNKRLLVEMFVSLSDLYDELDIKHTNISDHIGWFIDDGIIESDFSDAIVENGKAYVVMDFLRRPEYGYDDKSKYYG